MYMLFSEMQTICRFLHILKFTQDSYENQLEERHVGIYYSSTFLW